MKLEHGRVELWLSELAAAERGPPLLLLHGLGGSSDDFRQRDIAWRGPVYALDFSGHGRSGRMLGGCYYPELLAGDADAALAAIGGAHVLGVGLGAYVALLISGARRELIPATALLDGPGLAGAGAVPRHEPRRFSTTQDAGADGHLLDAGATDPAAEAALARDVRPPDYVLELAEPAGPLLFGSLDDPPPWWREAAALPNAAVVDGGLEAAVRALAER